MQHAPARLVLALAVAVAVVAGAAAPAHAKPDAKQAKINVYVDVLNQWSSYVYKQRDDYAAWVDLAKGPDCKSTKARGPSAIGDTAKTTTFPGYLKALKKGPKLPVDAAAVTMVTTLQALWQPSFDASEYYYKRQWKDDDCKRGRELHTQLVELWAQYVAAEAQVRAFVVQYNDDRELAQHAATAKKYGKKLRFQFEQVLIDGKQLVRTLDVALAATPIDAAAITAKLDAFAASVDATNQLAEANRGNRQDLRRAVPGRLHPVRDPRRLVQGRRRRARQDHRRPEGQARRHRPRSRRGREGLQRDDRRRQRRPPHPVDQVARRAAARFTARHRARPPRSAARRHRSAAVT
jgi:hypothetical protein